MFKRRRSQRVHPDVLIQDAYIKRRYEDLAVCIHEDIKNGRGRYNYYAPWLELKLQSFPTFYREKHSILEQNLPAVVENSHTPKSATKPTIFVSSNEATNGVAKNAWVPEDEDDKVREKRKPSTCIHVNRAQVSESTTTPHRTVEDGGNFAGVDVCEFEEVKLEEHSTTVVVQKCNSVSIQPQKTQTNSRSAFPNVVDREVVAEIQEEIATQTSLPVAQSGSSASSKICTIL